MSVAAPIVDFCVQAWSAWAPGLADAGAWRAWARAPHRPAGEGRPELPQYPMLLRRRAERLARMALQTVAEVRTPAPCPMIYASPRGETARAVPLLRELAQTGQVAPGPFSLAVHNAVAGLESIAHADTGSYGAIAAGGETAEAAIVEACTLLTDGVGSVIVTVYDELVPDCYRAYVEEPDAPYAYSLRVGRTGGPRFELAWGLGARGTGHGARGDESPPNREAPDLPVPHAPCPVPP
ncbi:MAG: beta-ketoacyl synthase chain length factor, partial [Xanthomonadales bacterium]|nr:beta-ketoacyl synthase chain length factor [Xanthomonadales bacterium]